MYFHSGATQHSSDSWSAWHQGCLCKTFYLYDKWNHFPLLYIALWQYAPDFEYVLFFRTVQNNWLCKIPLMVVLPAGCCKTCHLFTKSTKTLGSKEWQTTPVLIFNMSPSTSFDIQISHLCLLKSNKCHFQKSPSLHFGLQAYMFTCLAL